jgi:membrane protease YdiL (CAAX protease family)
LADIDGVPLAAPPPLAPPPVDRRWWGIGDFFIAAFAWFLLSVLAVSLLPRIDDKNQPVDLRAWSAVALISLPWLGLAGWPLVATRWKGNGPVRDLRLRLNLRGALIGVGFGLVGLVGAGILAAVQEQVTGHGISARAVDAFDTVDKANPLPLLLFALLAGFGAPIVEEIAFRGLLFGALEKRGTPIWGCVVITSVGFAVFHFEPERFFVLLPIAFALGLARARTGSTGSSIVAHMTVNLPAAITLAVAAFQH